MAGSRSASLTVVVADKRSLDCARFAARFHLNQLQRNPLLTHHASTARGEVRDVSRRARFVGRERLITISHSEDKEDGVVTVWYWGDPDERSATVR